MISVNLASKEVLKIAKANQLIDRLKLASVLAVVVFVIIVGADYGYFFLTNRQVASVSSDIEVVSGQITQMAETELWSRRLLSVAEEADRLVGLRKDFAGVLLDVYDLLPDEVMIEAVRFEGDVVVVEVMTNGVQAMSRALAVLSTVTVQDSARFDEVALSSVRRNDQGLYILRIELGLREAI